MSAITPNPSQEEELTTTTKSPSDNADSNYLNRLDFISVIVICAIVAFCFGICVVIGCRRKKRHPSQFDVTDSQLPSVTESRSEHRTTNLAYSPSELRIPESPPPTYSIIERQTSFTSYVSQSSSQNEIPPDYDEAMSFGDNEPYASRTSRPTSRTGSERSSGRFMLSRGASSAARSKRSESARTRGPPRSRSNRSSWDIVRSRRGRLSSRPATVSEDESSSCSFTASVVTDSSLGRNAAIDGASSTVNVIADVIPSSQDHVLNIENGSDAEVAQPLLPNSPSRSQDCVADDTVSHASCQKKEGSMTRKLTLV